MKRRSYSVPRNPYAPAARSRRGGVHPDRRKEAARKACRGKQEHP